MREFHDALAASDLPVADLAGPGRVFFRFWDDAGVIGFAGLEGEGADRLLRSLLVVADRRGDGLGRSIRALLENVARVMDVQRLHLLTDTAAPFFGAHGYDAAPGASAPVAIAASQEFAALCPASADYLVKLL